MFVWILGAFLATTFDKATEAGATWAGTKEESTIETLLDAKQISFKLTETGEYRFVGFNKDYFNTLWDVMTWDYNFLRGDYEIVRWVVLTPFTFAMVVGIILMFVQIFQGLFSFT